MHSLVHLCRSSWSQRCRDAFSWRRPTAQIDFTRRTLKAQWHRIARSLLRATAPGPLFPFSFLFFGCKEILRMFTEEWDSLDWEVSSQWSMKSVVLEMSVLFRVSFFLYLHISWSHCCSCVEIKRAAEEWKSGGTEGKAAWNKRHRRSDGGSGLSVENQ